MQKPCMLPSLGILRLSHLASTSRDRENLFIRGSIAFAGDSCDRSHPGSMRICHTALTTSLITVGDRALDQFEFRARDIFVIMA